MKNDCIYTNKSKSTGHMFLLRRETGSGSIYIANTVLVFIKARWMMGFYIREKISKVKCLNIYKKNFLIKHQEKSRIYQVFKQVWCDFFMSCRMRS